MIKKFFKIVGVALLLLIVAAFAVPYFFSDQIKAKIQKSINEKIDAKVSFSDVDLSFISNFPQANVKLVNLNIINKAPFLGDTLVSLQELNLKMSIKEFLKSANEPMNIEAISSSNGLINIIFNEAGQGNYDIALKNQAKTDDAKSKPLNLKISNYELTNFKFKYTDRGSKLKMVLDSINHTGKGDFAKDVLDLDTKSTATISLDKDKVNYMNRIKISLDAVLGIDLKNSKYTFKQNTAKINQLPLKLNGFIQLVDAGQLYDLDFKTPTSSFKNFLALIPAAYSGKIANVQTSGDFNVSGVVKGIKSATTVPQFNLAIASNNASFKYPSLPKEVKNIIIDTKIINQTGLLNDTFINLDKLSFAIDKDVFNAKASIKNIAENAVIDAALKGTINLSNLSKAYPIKMDKPLSGILDADVTTKFDMKSVETSQYQNINNAGSMRVSGFNYTDENGKTMKISTAAITFNPSKVTLQEFKATTGKSDVSITGVLENFYGFIFNKQQLKGNFNMVSNQIAVSDFMTAEVAKKEGEASKKATAMKIPAFLNCSINAKANTVLYDNLTLKAVSGTMLIQDQKVTIKNAKTNIFGGQIGMNGALSTKEKTPKFNMNLDLSKVDISQSFTQLDMLKKIAPIAGIISGKLNSTINLSGNLDAFKLTPDLKTITGDLLGQLLSTTVNANNSTLLAALDDKISFLDLKKLNLNDLKAILTFKDGKVNVKPFNLKYKDIKVTIAGTHGFDQLINYNLKFDVPAKYLGADANAILAKLSPADAGKIENIPINAIVGGSFSSPKITTDVQQATTNLVSNLVKQQQQRLIGRGRTALEDLLNPKNKEVDTTKTKSTANQASDLLNGLFGKKK